MVVKVTVEVLCDGAAQGEVLRLDAPISFWGGVAPETATVALARHPQEGACISDKILVVPDLIGSSSSSAVLLELIYRQRQPAALLLGDRDAILPIGVLVAQQMGWRTIPVLLFPDAPFQTGQQIQIEPGGIVLS